MVIWVIGMSASGKTVLGNEMLKFLTSTGQPWLFIDGDRFRNILGEDLGFTVGDRRKVGERVSRLCLECSTQGINVMACILSIFHEHQEFNRIHIPDYREIFIDVSMENLIRRDNKNVYKKALAGQASNVVGVDIEFPRPKEPDIVVDNNCDTGDLTVMASEILKTLGLLNVSYPYSATDGLLRREKYEYTKFVGYPFLTAYEQDRKKAIGLLSERIEVLSNSYGFESIPGPWSEVIGENAHFNKTWLDAELKSAAIDKFDGIIETKNLLIHLLMKNIESKDQIKETLEMTLRLLQRFEVSKRIYERYSLPEMTKCSDVYSPILPYALFSLLLQKLVKSADSQQTKAILMNATLKLGDIIASCLHRMATPCEQWLSYAALSSELEMISNYSEVIAV